MKLYTGFKDGKMVTMETYTDEGVYLSPDLFPNKAWAKRHYEDVREVKVVEVKNK